LGVVTADADTNRLRTEEHTDSRLVRRRSTADGRSLALRGHVGRFEEANTFEHETGRHDRLTSHEGGLAEALTHVDGSVGLHRGHQGVDLTIAGITSNFTEVAVLAQVHQEGRIANAAIETILVGRSVPLTQALHHAQQVILNVELSLLGVGVGEATDGEITGVVVTTLAVRRLTLGNSFQEFVNEHPITPTTIVVEQSQGTDRLVESGKVTGIQQKTLSSNKGFASNLKSAWLGGIRRVRRTSVTLLS